MIRIGIALSAIAFLIAAGFSWYGWVNTPPDAQIPVHFNFAGEADRYGSKAEGFLFMPALLAGLALMMAAIPAIDPRGQNARRSRPVLLVAWTIGAVALAGGQAMITLNAVGQPLGPELMARGAGAFVALTLLALGLVMAKARPNFFIGVRTPWTLSSDLAWDKTHRWAGRIYTLLGLAGLGVVLLTADPGLAVVILIGTLLAATLGLVVYSFIVWKTDPARETLSPDDA